MPLAPDSLQDRRRDARVSGERFVEAAYTLQPGIVACNVEHIAATDNVIDAIRLPGARQTHRPIEIGCQIDLIGIDKDQVEWSCALCGKLRQSVERRA